MGSRSSIEVSYYNLIDNSIPLLSEKLYTCTGEDKLLKKESFDDIPDTFTYLLAEYFYNYLVEHTIMKNKKPHLSFDESDQIIQLVIKNLVSNLDSGISSIFRDDDITAFSDLDKDDCTHTLDHRLQE